MDRRFIFLMLFIFLLPIVSAFKVGPAAQSFTLEPGTVSEYGLRIFNDGGDSLAVSVSADGPFANQIVLEPTSFVMGPDERERRIIVTVTHPPADLLDPGKNTVKLRVSAKPEGEGQFSSAVSLNHNLNLYRRYEGTYIEGSLAVKDAPEQGSEAVFTLSLANRGTEEGSVTGTIVLLEENPVATIPLGTTLLAADSEGKLAKKWLATLEPGRYDTKTTYTYDDRGLMKENVLDGSMMVGTPRANFMTSVNELQAENIESLDLSATLFWNEPVEAEAVVALLQDEKVVVQMTTPTTKLTPGTSTGFSAFLEVPTIASGDYTLRVTARTTDGLSLAEETFPVAVTTQLEIVPSLDEPSSFVTPLFILLIIVLITFGLRWFKTRKR